MICNSYESGYGHGLANDGLDLSKTPHTDSQLAEAYRIGYEAGAEARKSSAIMLDERAIRIALRFSEEWIRVEGEPTDAPDEYTLPDVKLDSDMEDCIEHLCWYGKAVRHRCDDGYTIVQFGDFTLSGGG